MVPKKTPSFSLSPLFSISAPSPLHQIASPNSQQHFVQKLPKADPAFSVCVLPVQTEFSSVLSADVAMMANPRSAPFLGYSMCREEAH